jgi:hypothetical protein
METAVPKLVEWARSGESRSRAMVVEKVVVTLKPPFFDSLSNDREDADELGGAKLRRSTRR